MSISLRSPQDADQRLLDQKDKIRAFYTMLQDIPEEKALFDGRKEGLTLESIFQDPMMLRWMGLRIRQRIQEASTQIAEALTRSTNGVLDLSRKDLCDLTIRDFSAPLIGIKKVILSGNFLRTMPPFLAHKPYLYQCEAVGNLNDVEELFYDFRRKNQFSLDLLEILKTLSELDFEESASYRALFDQISINPEKATVAELAFRVNALMEVVTPSVQFLAINPDMFNGLPVGGVRGFINLDHFTKLKELDLSGCQLEHRAPLSWLSKLKSLTSLNLSRTTIRELPQSIVDVPLRSLDISFTAIQRIPEWLVEVATLENLNVANTPITSLPKLLSTLPLRLIDLQGTDINELPSFLLKAERVSIQSTRVGKLPLVAYKALREQRLQIDHTNKLELRLQARIAQEFHSDHLAHAVFLAELFKLTNQQIPTGLKVAACGIEYITLIAMLGVWQFLRLAVTPAFMCCSKRKGMQSRDFIRFKEQNEALVASAFYLYVLFHLIPMQQNAKDIKQLNRYLMRI